MRYKRHNEFFGIKMYILQFDRLYFSTSNNIRITINKISAMTAEHLLYVKSCKYSACPPQWSNCYEHVQQYIIMQACLRITTN